MVQDGPLGKKNKRKDLRLMIYFIYKCKLSYSVTHKLSVFLRYTICLAWYLFYILDNIKSYKLQMRLMTIVFLKWVKSFKTTTLLP